MSRKTRKLMWSVPLIAAVAVIGALAAFMTLTPNGAAAQDAEVMDYQAGSPLELMVEPGSGAAKRTSLVLTWKAPTGGSELPITGYRIDESKDGQRWTMATDGMVGPDVTTYTDTGLKPGALMYYRVLALNRAGTGRVSEAKSNTTAGIGEPSEVQNFTVTAAGPSSIKLNWDPPADDGGTRIIGYLIHFGDTVANIPERGMPDMDGNSDMIVPVLAPTTEWTHKGLDGSTTRHYKVYAVNWYDDDMTSKMTKDPIDIRNATTAPPGKPAAPTGLTVVPEVVYCGTDTDRVGMLMLDDDSDCDGTPADTATDAYEPAPNVNLYWYFPTDEGGADITRFRIEVSKTGAWPDGSVPTAGTAGDANITLAMADFAVMVVTRDDAFGATNSYQFPHEGAGPFLKSPGTLHYRVFAENGELTDGVARRSLPDTGGAQTRATRAMTVSPRPAPLLPTALNWVNEGAEDGAPAKGSTHHHDTVNLSWNAPANGRTPNAYRVDFAEGTTAPIKWKPLEPDTRHSDPTYDHIGWRPKDIAQTFQYRVFAKDGGLIGIGSEPDSNAVDAQTAPSPVRMLASAPASAKQIDLTWQKPVNDGGTDITKYCVLATTMSVTAQPLLSTNCTAAAPTGVTRKFVDAPRVGVLTESAPDTMFMHKSLMANTTYRYRVYAMNDATVADTALTEPVSPSSEEDPAKTMSTVKPGAPTNLSAESAADSNFTATGARGVLVIWNGPADPAGANVSGYEIQRKVNDGEFLLVQETSSRTTHYTDRSQPADDEVRMYRVRARNTLGWGPWTDPVATHPLPDRPNMAPTTVGSIMDRTMTVGDAASTMNVMGYFRDADGDTLTYSAMSSDTAVATADIPTGSNMLTVTPMAAGTTTVTVTATDPAGETAPQTFTVTVEAAPIELMAPSNVRANPQGSGLVQVEWDTASGAHGYTVVAINVDDLSPTSKVIDGAGAVVTQITLTQGETYNIYVGSWAPGNKFEVDFSEKKRVEVE